MSEMTKQDKYPLHLIEETLAQISKPNIFTKLDIRQAFHRIRLDPEAKDMSTFRTRYCSYKYNILPFGFTNGPATFQRYINQLLFGYLDVFCSAYLDDILIYSDDPLEHMMHVHQVFDRLEEGGLQVDIKKSEFSVTKTKYLGFVVTTEGIEVDPAKIEAIKY